MSGLKRGREEHAVLEELAAERDVLSKQMEALGKQIEALGKQSDSLEEEKKALQLEKAHEMAALRALEGRLATAPDKSTEDDIRTKQQAVTAIRTEIAAKDQAIAAKDQAIAAKVQAIAAKVQAIGGIRTELGAKQQAIRDAQKAIAARKPTYESLLRNKTNKCTLGIPDMSGRRHGRRDFDHALQVASDTLLQNQILTTQLSVALVNQCASGVGKTFGGITFRRGQRELCPAVQYEPVCVYLGFNMNFNMTYEEGIALSAAGGNSNATGVVQSVLYQRLGFALDGMLNELASTEGRAKGFEVFDGGKDVWVQRLACPAMGSHYEFSNDVEKPSSNTHLIEMLSRMQAFTTKTLVMLVMVDEGQMLDACIPPTGNSGGARLALRLLRELQVAVYNATGGHVLLMPLTTGINADVSLTLGPTEGRIVVLGHTGDEALMTPADFEALTRKLMAGKIHLRSVKESSAFVRVVSAAYYPHVRPLVEEPTKVNLTKHTYDLTPHMARDIVLHAFCEVPMLLVGGFPRSYVAVRAVAAAEGVPIPSFYYWRQIHLELFKDYRFPVESVDRTWFEDMELCQYFEVRCFNIFGYFLRVFGPIQTKQFQDRLRAPLKEWLPTYQFGVSTSEKLSDSRGRMNPFQTAPIGKRTKMGDTPLAPDYATFLRSAMAAAAAAAPAMPQGVWAMCGGNAPIDYVLTVVHPPVNGTVRVALRFADAKHTTKWGTAAKRLPKGLQTETVGKAQLLHKDIAKRLATDKVFGEAVVVAVDAFDAAHAMVCHNEDDDRCLSPSTFVWRPWSNILFCRP